MKKLALILFLIFIVSNCFSQTLQVQIDSVNRAGSKLDIEYRILYNSADVSGVLELHISDPTYVEKEMLKLKVFKTAKKYKAAIEKVSEWETYEDSTYVEDTYKAHIDSIVRNVTDATVYYKVLNASDVDVSGALTLAVKNPIMTSFDEVLNELFVVARRYREAIAKETTWDNYEGVTINVN